jgi:arylsulfatase A-like enzyme
MPNARELGGAAAVAALVLALAGADQPASGQSGGGKRPNVVVIMSDDQTQDSLRYMQRVRGLVGDRGASFPTMVANWPLCCPSRATFLTGQYAHNHQVLGNAPPFGGFDRLDSSRTLPVWLQGGGYYTAHIGKYLNGYEGSATGVPAGWTEWHGSKRTYTFYGYELLEDGERVEYGSRDENPDAPGRPDTYSTDVYTDKAVDLIGRRAPAKQPFFLSLAYLAPHGGGPNPEPPNTSRCNNTAKPAGRHLGALASEPLPQPPSFNEADVTDKPAGLASREALTPENVATISRRYRCRGESLLAIDDGVERVVDALAAADELDDTLVIFTSDNGFFHGEHRIASGKNRVYEEAVRVPLLMRGPGIPAGKRVDEIASNADLAPTILDAAGIEPPTAVDGRSLLPAAQHPRRLRGRELLIEQRSGDDDVEANGVFYTALRNARYTYVSNSTGETELYDLESDPFQLSNQVANPAYDRAEAVLAARLAALARCSGPSCRSKPALELKLSRSVRQRGRSCRPAKDFRARVRGGDARRVEEVEFRVGSRAEGRDATLPFKERIKPGLLRRKRKPELRAYAALVDGRELSLQKRVRTCR